MMLCRFRLLILLAWIFPAGQGAAADGGDLVGDFVRTSRIEVAERTRGPDLALIRNTLNKVVDHAADRAAELIRMGGAEAERLARVVLDDAWTKMKDILDHLDRTEQQIMRDIEALLAEIDRMATSYLASLDCMARGTVEELTGILYRLALPSRWNLCRKPYHANVFKYEIFEIYDMHVCMLERRLGRGEEGMDPELSVTDVRKIYGELARLSGNTACIFRQTMPNYYIERFQHYRHQQMIWDRVAADFSESGSD